MSNDKKLLVVDRLICMRKKGSISTSGAYELLRRVEAIKQS